MGRNSKNKGFTLIELMTALAVASLLLFGLFSFLMNSVRSYEKNRQMVNMQLEAQMALNLVLDAIMEGKQSGAEGLIWDASEQRLFTGTSNQKLFVYDAGEEKLYLLSGIVAVDEDLSSYGDLSPYLAAEHITAFSVDDSEPKNVKVSLAVTMSGQTHTVSGTATPRNQ